MNNGGRAKMVALLCALGALVYGTVLSTRIGGGDSHISLSKSRPRPANEPVVTLKIPPGKSASNFGYVTSIVSPTEEEFKAHEESVFTGLDCVSYSPERRGKFPAIAVSVKDSVLLKTPKLRGRVLLGGGGLADAIVQVEGSSVFGVTDEKGEFEIEGLEEGKYELRAVHRTEGTVKMRNAMMTKTGGDVELRFKGK